MSQEKDFLVYEGNRIPRFIRFAWTILIVFAIVYLLKNALPDLKLWIQRLK